MGDNIVTAGTVSSRLDSLFPPGIPIGQVTSVDSSNPFKAVHVRPFATLRKLDYVQILTHGTRGVRSTQAGQALASLPPPGQQGSGASASRSQTASTQGGP